MACAELSESSARRTSRSGCSTGSSGSNIAAMIRAGICTIDGRPARAAPGRGQARQSRARARRRIRSAARRHRAHPLGDPRRADRRQRPPAHRRAGGAGPQRHHREFQAAARRADRRGAHVRERDRQRGRRPSRRARDRARRVAAGRGRGGAAAADGAFAIAFLFRDHPDLIIGARHGRAADRRLWRGRELSRLGRAGGGAVDPAHRLSRRGRLGGRPARPRSRFSTATTSRSSARSSNSARPRRRSRRAITATTCRRRFSSSRSWLPRLSKATSARSRARSRCRSPRPISESSTALTIVACGTSYYAGLVAKYWVEQFARVPVDIDVASEFRYREPVLEPGGLALFIQPVGRDRRHARRAAPRARRGAAHRGRRQRPDQLDGARGRPAAADPRRAGDRRRLDQGVHLPAGGARRARREPRAGQGPADAATRRKRSSRTSRRRRRRSTPRSAMTRTSRRWRI